MLNNKTKKKYSHAERVAFHKGYGVGCTGLGWLSFERMGIESRFKTKEERISFAKGMLEGNEIHKKIRYAIANNKISKNTRYHWEDYWALHDE